MTKSLMRASIVIPTYHEVDNIEPLTERLFKALGSLKASTELIIVDDNSSDGTEEAVNALAKKGFPVRVIVRKTERGLSSAVLRGFLEAKGDVLLCMDADLQHPPESVPDMLKAMQETEFAIGTRYADGETMSADKNWAWYRRIISKGARLLARPLTPLSDPMTGFFALKRGNFIEHIEDINPVGFKIALELYVKCNIQKHKEVPIAFGVRTAGQSKLTGKVMIYYLKHLRDLYFYRYPSTKFIFPITVLLLFWFATWVLAWVATTFF